MSDVPIQPEPAPTRTRILPPDEPAPEPGVRHRGRTPLGWTLAGVGAVLALILLTVIMILQSVIVSQLHDWREEQQKAQCIYVAHSNDIPGREGITPLFSDLDATNRALADLYDCDIQGR